MTVSIEKRHVVSAGFGNKWFESNSKFLRTILPEEQYFNNGVVYDGLLIFKFIIKKDRLEALFMWLVELVTGKGKARDEVLEMWKDILELFKTGKIPSWLPDIKKVTDFLEANDNCLSAEGRFTFGLALAVGGSVSKVAKIRLEAGATGIKYKRVDIAKIISTEIIKKFIVENFALFLNDEDDG